MLGEKNLARRTIGELPWSRGEIVKGNLIQKPDSITIDTHRKIGYYFVRPHYDVNSLGALLPFLQMMLRFIFYNRDYSV